MAEIVWTPDEQTLAHANVVRLMRRHGLDDYRELVARSQEEPEWFWPAAVEDMGLEFSRPVGAGLRRFARAGMDDLVRRLAG